MKKSKAPCSTGVLLSKTQRVLNSCETKEQLETAKKYKNIVMTRIENRKLMRLSAEDVFSCRVFLHDAYDKKLAEYECGNAVGGDK